VVWLGFEEDCIVTSCQIGESTFHRKTPWPPSFARALRTIRLVIALRAGTPAASHGDPHLHLLNSSAFVMQIRKWIANNFSRRPHQNMGPAEGRRDQRRRSIYSFDYQPIILERLVYIGGGIVLSSGLLQTAYCNGLLDQTLFSGLRRQHPCCPDACFTCKTCMLFAEVVIFSPTHVHLHAHAAHKGCTAACARAWRSLLCIL
jgi:hypothetical protein